MRPYRRRSAGVALAASALLMGACGRGAEDLSNGGSGAFQDVTRSAGLSFTYDNDFSPAHRFVETTGGGCAFFDYDNDGLPDIFAVQGGPAPGSPPHPRPPSALYRNLGGGRFQDVTREAGLAVDTGYGQGVAVADYDNDGWQDLLVTAYGALHLFHNDRGRFREVTKEAGLLQGSDPHGHTSAAWADYDSDGYLDLAVCRYASWFADNERPCFDDRQRAVYCVPTAYATDASVLYHNDRRGRFTDVSKQAGFAATAGRGLGALWLDYDGDGRQDLFLAHDMAANNLMRNLGSGRFKDMGAEAAVALGPDGQPLSGMGVTAADFRGTGREDVFVVNFSRQPRAYYLSEGKGVSTSYRWGGPWAGIGDPQQPYLAFAVESLDYDRDGWSDLVIGNGHINDVLEEPQEGVSYRERQQLLRNRGDGRFEDDRNGAGDLAQPRVTRGLAVGDYDNDGRPDVMVVGPRQPLQLFHNAAHPERHWVGFRLEGVKGNRDGVGAQVRVESGGRRQMRVVRSGSSYCSHSDVRPLFGLADRKDAVRVEVAWPSGETRDYGSLPPDGYYLLREDGVARPDPRLAADRPSAREEAVRRLPASGEKEGGVRDDTQNPAVSGRGKEKR